VIDKRNIMIVWPTFALRATVGNLRLACQPELTLRLPRVSEGWSGKRDSNPRLRPWQGRTLPLSYSRLRRNLRVPRGFAANQPSRRLPTGGGDSGLPSCLTRMPPLISPSPTGLFWNTRGNIRCDLHARDIDATQWEAEGWAPVPLSEKPQSRRYQCQRCSPDGNAIATD
jgi:hypothetical protein